MLSGSLNVTLLSSNKQLPPLSPKMTHVCPRIKLTFHKFALFAFPDTEDENQVRRS